jgi:hypothetical protein
MDIDGEPLLLRPDDQSDAALSTSLDDLLRRLSARGVSQNELSALRAHVHGLVNHVPSSSGPTQPQPNSPPQYQPQPQPPQPQPQRSPTLEIFTSIRTRADTLLAAFTLPTHLDLTEPPPGSTLGLAPTPPNLTALRLEAALTALIGELDGVADPAVREQRREAVQYVQRGLTRLEDAVRARRTAAAARVDALSAAYAAHYAGFVLPAALVYAPPAPEEAFELPAVASNAPVHAYFRALAGIKTELHQLRAGATLLATVDAELEALAQDIHRRRGSPTVPAPSAFDDALAALDGSAHALCVAFCLPATLDLAPPPACAPAGLVAVPMNRPVLEHFAALERLLARAEELETAGNDDARWKRKRLVRTINAELERIEADVRRRREEEGR